MNALHTMCRTGCDAAVIAPAATVSDAIDVARDENAVQVEDDKDGGIPCSMTSSHQLLPGVHEGRMHMTKLLGRRRGCDPVAAVRPVAEISRDVPVEFRGIRPDRD